MKIDIRIGGRTLTARLDDTPAGRDFAALLPLTLELADFNQTELVADLPRRLSTEGAPGGERPQAGDITYYAPWGNLAIFHREFAYAPGLVRLGQIEGDLAGLRNAAGEEARISRAECTAVS